MACMADYDEDCKGKKPEGCMCVNCCAEKAAYHEEPDCEGCAQDHCDFCGMSIDFEFESKYDDETNLCNCKLYQDLKNKDKEISDLKIKVFELQEEIVALKIEMEKK